jgi:hypothetical protein
MNHSVYVRLTPRDFLLILSVSVVLISHFHPSLTGSTISVRFQSETKGFSLYHSVYTCSGAHPASYPVGVVRSFAGDKTARTRS